MLSSIALMYDVNCFPSTNLPGWTNSVFNFMFYNGISTIFCVIVECIGIDPGFMSLGCLLGSPYEAYSWMYFGMCVLTAGFLAGLGLVLLLSYIVCMVP